MTEDPIYDEFRDLLQEVPEAEDAIRSYRALREKQVRDAAKAPSSGIEPQREAVTPL